MQIPHASNWRQGALRRPRQARVEPLLAMGLALLFGISLQATPPKPEAKGAAGPAAPPAAAPAAPAGDPATPVEALSIRSAFDPFLPEGSTVPPECEPDIRKVIEHYLLKAGDTYRINADSLRQLCRDRALYGRRGRGLPPGFVELDGRSRKEIAEVAQDFLPLFDLDETATIRPGVVYHATSSTSASAILRSGFRMGIRGKPGGDGLFGYPILGLGAGVYASEDLASTRIWGDTTLKIKLRPDARILDMNRPGVAPPEPGTRVAAWEQFLVDLGAVIRTTRSATGDSGITFNEAVRRLVRVFGYDGVMGNDFAGGASRVLVIGNLGAIESVAMVGPEA